MLNNHINNISYLSNTSTIDRENLYEIPMENIFLSILTVQCVLSLHRDGMDFSPKTQNIHVCEKTPSTIPVLWENQYFTASMKHATIIL